MNDKERDIKDLYEYYFTEDLPIPYITIFSKKRIKELQNKINKTKEYLNELYSIGKIDETSEIFIKGKQLIEENEKEINNQTLLIYPVSMSDYFLFYSCISVFLLEKDKIPDPNIISMSYLDYIFYLKDHDKKGQTYMDMLVTLLHLCFKIDYPDIRYKKNDSGNIILVLNGIEVNKKDFDIIRRIICYQNMPDYDDTYIDPQLKQDLEEMNKMKNKELGTTTLERQKICVAKEYGYKLSELNELTIRKFVLMLQIADAQLHYQIYRTGECSGLVSFKEPITHYLHVKDTRFDGLQSYDSFKEKVKHVANFQ